MELQIHNSMSRRKERFEPLDPSHVRMYVCGPTVYDTAHIGNARPVVVFDTLYRVLKRLYPKVTYARNITDIDDKIIERALQRGVHIDTITEETIAAYHADMAAVGALPPDVEPRCTRTVPQMVAMIAALVQKGHAYAAQGHVLFDVTSFADYGKLSGRSRDEQIAGSRVEVAPYKKDPGDFVLWKPSTPEQPGWDSPWGRGRPGWHIECSAMAKDVFKVLTIDIHGGGHDLIFPHHENEIAQSVCAHDGVQFSKYWMHNGFLVVNGEKMSKSLGNFFTVRDLLAKWPGEAIRLLLLKTHYRAPLDFTEEGLREAKGDLDRFYTALRGSVDVAASSAKADAVQAALCDDLNTSKALAEMHQLARQLSSKRTPDAKAALIDAGRLLGLLDLDPNRWFDWAPDEETREKAKKYTFEYGEARRAGQYDLADRIRIEAQTTSGVSVSATTFGPMWVYTGKK
ncbi:MAG: cysteine--tRNA ligase [Proteobacteria bacterium]|nr:cysteine--tRNA ligase [Pseudomonadota bacterium]